MVSAQTNARTQRSTVLALATCAAITFFLTPAASQDFPQAKGPARTVKMFSFFCLSHLPDLEGVKQAAGFGEFAQIDAKDLEQYQPAVRADELHAWSFHDHGAKYVLTAARAKPDDAFKQQEPKFAGATNFACSLRIPTADNPPDGVVKELTALLGEAPGKAWTEGDFKVHVWTKKADKIMSLMHYYAPLPGKDAKGLLSAGVYVRK